MMQKHLIRQHFIMLHCYMISLRNEYGDLLDSVHVFQWTQTLWQAYVNKK